jgi:hypothetical protein
MKCRNCPAKIEVETRLLNLIIYFAETSCFTSKWPVSRIQALTGVLFLWYLLDNMLSEMQVSYDEKYFVICYWTHLIIYRC